MTMTERPRVSMVTNGTELVRALHARQVKALVLQAFVQHVLDQNRGVWVVSEDDVRRLEEAWATVLT